MTLMDDPEAVGIAAYAKPMSDHFEVEVLVPPNAPPEMIFAVAETLRKAAFVAAQAGGTEKLAEGASGSEPDATGNDKEWN